MSDSFLALIGMGWLAGLLTGGIMIGALVANGVDKKQSNRDRSGDIHLDMADWRSRGNRIHQVSYEEEVINGLQGLRMSLSRSEKEYLDYACECVQKVDRVNKYIEEGLNERH